MQLLNHWKDKVCILEYNLRSLYGLFTNLCSHARKHVFLSSHFSAWNNIKQSTQLNGRFVGVTVLVSYDMGIASLVLV